jgi:hypothetical protein
MAVGWDAKAWGYHGDDGGIFAEGFIQETAKYKEGNTVGCGVNFEKEAIFFTKEGRLLGSHHSMKSKKFLLMPTTRDAILENPREAISVYQCPPDYERGPNFCQVC